MSNLDIKQRHTENILHELQRESDCVLTLLKNSLDALQSTIELHTVVLVVLFFGHSKKSPSGTLYKTCQAPANRKPFSVGLFSRPIHCCCVGIWSLYMAKVYIQILTRVCIDKNYTFVAVQAKLQLSYILLPSIHDTNSFRKELEMVI